MVPSARNQASSRPRTASQAAPIRPATCGTSGKTRARDSSEAAISAVSGSVHGLIVEVSSQPATAAEAASARVASDRLRCAARSALSTAGRVTCSFRDLRSSSPVIPDNPSASRGSTPSSTTESTASTAATSSGGTPSASGNHQAAISTNPPSPPITPPEPIPVLRPRATAVAARLAAATPAATGPPPNRFPVPIQPASTPVAPPARISAVPIGWVA